jgi:hypothetical protein
VKTELDSLATALYVKTDDLLKASPHLASWRPAVGIAPQLTDAELVTLAMLQAMLGFTSEARWLRHARSHLRHLFPYLPKQPGYNKRLRKAAKLLRRVTRLLATDTSVWSDEEPPRSSSVRPCIQRHPAGMSHVRRRLESALEISDYGCELGFRGFHVVVGFVLDGRNLPYLTVESSVVVPVDPLCGGQLDLGERLQGRWGLISSVLYRPIVLSIRAWS